MSRPADEPTPEGYGKVPGLPMMRYCNQDGSVVVDVEAHDRWHARPDHESKDCGKCGGSYFIVTADDEYNCDCGCHS